MKNNTTYNITTSKEYTVDEFIKYWQSIVPKNAQAITQAEFFEVRRNDTGPKNIDVIYNSYDALDQEKYKDAYANQSLSKINKGVTLAFPIISTTIMLQEAVNQKQFLKQSSFDAYWNDNYKELISDPEYQPADYLGYIDDNESLMIRYHSLNVKIWIYLKSIDKVIDVSPYIINVTTSKVFSGSSFSIDLVSFKDLSINKSTGNYFDIINTVTGKGFEYKSFLEKFLQVNDIVFIRFERLQCEKEEKSQSKDTIEISKNKLSNNSQHKNVWDMIGIIDSCVENYNSQNNIKLTSIIGRDIEKLFVEDGSYFLPLREIQGSQELWWYCGGTNDAWFKRNIITGDFQYLWSYGFKKLNEMIFFIINIMSNLGLVKSDVFDSWNDIRTTSYEITGAPTLEVKGIWQIVKVFVEDAIQQRVVVDSSIGNPNGTLMDYMNRICQQPFVEFFFDTYVNTIDIIVRQPPFTEKAIMGVVSSGKFITIKSQDVRSCNLSYDSRVYSWYQIHMQNMANGGDNEYVSLAFVPIVYLNNYAELWGNRKLEITDIYLKYEEKKGIEDTEKFTTMQAAVLNDLLFLIETNAYLPFTRRGTIEINGDRRVKIGTFILNEFTNEFFYVTGVTNNVSFTENGLQRTTILQVERGMYYPLLTGDTGSIIKRKDNSIEIGKTPEKGNYFGIVKLDTIKEAINKAQAGEKVSLQNPIVDQTQFEYFLNRKMFG